MSKIASHKIDLPSLVFSLAAHPSKPILTAGCISGHVYSYTWSQSESADAANDSDDDDSNADDDTTGYKVLWKTRRHKGSCRCIGYSSDGQTIYTAGTDQILKVASTSTGIVIAKALIPSNSSSSEDDFPTTLLPINPHALLLGTDDGHVHVYDTRTSISTRPSNTFSSVHSSYVSSITALPPTSESTSGESKQFITTGDTTLSALDIRKGVITTSDDQEDDLTSSCVISGVGKNGRSTRAYVGLAGGIIHAFERGVWGDMCERIKVGPKGASVNVMADVTKAMVGNFGLGYGGGSKGGEGRYLAAGCEDGVVRVVALGRNQIVKEFRHLQEKHVPNEVEDNRRRRKKRDEEEEDEGITAVVVDCDGAMITAAGDRLRAWYEKGAEQDKDEDDDSDDSDDDDDDDDSDAEEKKQKVKVVRKAAEVEDSSDNDSDSDSDSGKEKKKRKKKKKNKITTKGNPVKKKPKFSGLD